MFCCVVCYGYIDYVDGVELDGQIFENMFFVSLERFIRMEVVEVIFELGLVFFYVVFFSYYKLDRFCELLVLNDFCGLDIGVKIVDELEVD